MICSATGGGCGLSGGGATGRRRPAARTTHKPRIRMRIIAATDDRPPRGDIQSELGALRLPFSRPPLLPFLPFPPFRHAVDLPCPHASGRDRRRRSRCWPSTAPVTRRRAFVPRLRVRVQSARGDRAGSDEPVRPVRCRAGGPCSRGERRDTPGDGLPGSAIGGRGRAANADCSDSPSRPTTRRAAASS